jgi:hypothetical protein
MPVLESYETTYTVRWIARCTVKGCKGTSSALLRSTHRTTVSGLPTGGGLRRDSRQTGVETVEGDWFSSPLPMPRTMPCGHAPEKARLRNVKGTTTDRECDSRCMGAVGPSCECSCGGRNHGAAFAA